jgi:hypothetical protein
LHQEVSGTNRCCSKVLLFFFLFLEFPSQAVLFKSSGLETSMLLTVRHSYGIVNMRFLERRFLRCFCSSRCLDCCTVTSSNSPSWHRHLRPTQF